MLIINNGRAQVNYTKGFQDSKRFRDDVLGCSVNATAGQIAEELGITIDGVDYNIRKNKEEWCKFCVSFLGAVSKEKVPQ